MCEETGFTWPIDLVARRLDAAAEDEALAAAARAHYRSDGLPTLTWDATAPNLLATDERLLAIRRSASIDPRPHHRSWPLAGQLAITTERVMMVGKKAVTIASFDELDDVTLATDRLFVVLTSGAGFVIRSCHPRLLRVQLAEARASRIDRQAGASSNAAMATPTDLPRR
jgi:hypothetical protein